MECDFDLACKIINEVIASMNGCNKKIKDMIHRDDYQDYIVLFDDMTFCPLRDKLITSFYDDPEGDIVKEIKFQITNAEVADEFNEHFDIGAEEGEEEKVDDLDMGI